MAESPARGEISDLAEPPFRFRRALKSGVLALVSHGDVIKAALAHYLGVHLDHLERFDIAPGSISILVDDERGSQVKLLNGTN